MKKGKCTPGPWHIETRGDGHRIVAEVGATKLKCTIATAHGMAPHDAYLIAAAPELLEALCMVRDADEDCKRDSLPTIPPMARAKIDAAIAKAEGRMP